MKLFVIVNPQAGRGMAGRRQAELERLLHEAGLECRLVRTAARGDAIALAQRGAEQGYTTIVAVGGDGTISEVANGIMLAGRAGARRPQLAMVPIGTGNDFIASLDNVRPNDLAGSVVRLVRNQVRPVDVGRVNGRFFINAVGMGLDAQVTIESLKIRGLSGFAVYVAGLVRALAVYRASPMLLRFDGQRIAGPALFVNISNGISHGGGFRLTPDAKIDDGQLDICFVANVPLLRILRAFPKVLKGTHTSLEGVTMGRAARVIVSCPNAMPLAADGEVLAPDARLAELETLPGALEVVC